MITDRTIPLTEIEDWKPTMNLRWRELPLWEHQETGEVKILEQEWINNLGEVEWREIPTV